MRDALATFTLGLLLALAFLLPASFHAHNERPTYEGLRAAASVEKVPVATRTLPEGTSRRVRGYVAPRSPSLTSRGLSRSIAGVEGWRGLVAVYFDAAYVDDALSVMAGESGGRSGVVNPIGCSGLFQIHPCHFSALRKRALAEGLPPDPLDPATNAMYAAHMSNYGRNWSSWEVKP